MKILSAANRVATPWKNGGGTTSEIIVHPANAGLDSFDWRVSIADVRSDGPFSLFPGIDRTLTILSGTGILLDVNGTHAALNAQSPPHPFAGDVPTSATLLDGPVTDLNVMSHRGKIRHDVRRLTADGPIHVNRDFETTLLIWVTGNGEVMTPGGSACPAPLDAMLCDRPGPWTLSASGPLLAYLVTIDRLPPG